MIDLKKIIKEKGKIFKFEGVAPDGFLLIHENAFEELMNEDVWNDVKNGKITIKELNNKHLNVK